MEAARTDKAPAASHDGQPALVRGLQFTDWSVSLGWEVAGPGPSQWPSIKYEQDVSFLGGLEDSASLWGGRSQVCISLGLQVKMPRRVEAVRFGPGACNLRSQGPISSFLI